MAFYQRGGNRPKNNSAKLTGLFRTKRRELLTGTIKAEYLDGLIDKIKEAKAAKVGLVIFCWKNDRGTDERSAVFNLSAGIETPREGRSSGGGGGYAQRGAPRRAIEPDPVDDDTTLDNGDDPFA